MVLAAFDWLQRHVFVTLCLLFYCCYALSSLQQLWYRHHVDSMKLKAIIRALDPKRPVARAYLKRVKKKLEDQ